MALSYREQVKLAHELGAKYEMGYWKFPNPELKATFQRRVSGMEWTEEHRKTADEALRKLREQAAKNTEMLPLEPEGK